MSTSSSPALAKASPPEVLSFSYSEVASAASSSPREPVQVSSSGDEQKRREAALLEQGRQEGELRARGAYEAQLEQLRSRIGAALTDFTRERRAYYQQVETEVVQLALSIAQKILHRESQVDPLLLAGLVHVALQQIESGTKTMLRANPQQVSELRSYFAHHMDTQDAPEIVEDFTVARDCCMLQTSLGTTQVGIDPQMKEIEQGLCDLLARRPLASP